MNKTFETICKEHNISPSITRRQIYRYLESVHDAYHPTVDDIYKVVKEEIPTLSKTTVYNVLNLFIKHKLANSIQTENNEKKYEIYHEHSHFICNVCQKIYDIPNVQLSYNIADLSQFQVDDEEVILKGICPDCMKSNIT